MSVLRKINTKLAATTGYQLRRVPVPRPANSAAPGKAAPRTPRVPRPPAGEPRPPADPAVDRLLVKPVFILASVRSGSTLLRMMLNGHPQLHSPHELHITDLEVNFKAGPAQKSFEALGLRCYELEGMLWDRAMHRELVKSGKSFLVEKTPGNLFDWQRIAACWPDARYIFLRRHPASVAQSWHEAHPTYTQEQTAARVLRYMDALEAAHAELGGHVLRYEDLIADPAGELRRVCAFLELDWEPAMLEYGDTLGETVLGGGFGDWNDKIRTGEVQPGRPLPAADEIPAVLRPTCKAWGYE